jgi:carbon storage regulator
MLVLSRKAGQQIQIGDSIVVTLVRINPQEVRIGIDAPPEVHIVRNELCDAAEQRCEPALPR